MTLFVARGERSLGAYVAETLADGLVAAIGDVGIRVVWLSAVGVRDRIGLPVSVVGTRGCRERVVIVVRRMIGGIRAELETLISDLVPGCPAGVNDRGFLPSIAALQGLPAASGRRIVLADDRRLVNDESGLPDAVAVAPPRRQRRTIDVIVTHR